MLNWNKRPIRCDWISIFFIFCFWKIHFTPLDLEIYQFSRWFLQYYTLPLCTFGVKRIQPFHHYSLLMYVARVIWFENTYKPAEFAIQTDFRKFLVNSMRVKHFSFFLNGTWVSETRVPRFFTWNSSFLDSSSTFFSFWVHVRFHLRGNGLELEFQKQSNLLKCFIRILYSKIFSKKLLFGKFCPYKPTSSQS